jgi:arylsulfatase A-like enzyme
MGIRTPIMARYPGRAKPRRVETPVSAVDLYTTALAAAGVAKPADAPGVNLLQESAVEKRGPVFGSAFLHTAVTLKDPAANLRSRYIIDGPWKLIAHFDSKENRTIRSELFNLVDDPQELRDRGADEPGKLADLTNKLGTWWSPHKRA